MMLFNSYMYHNTTIKISMVYSIYSVCLRKLLWTNYMVSQPCCSFPYDVKLIVSISLFYIYTFGIQYHNLVVWLWLWSFIRPILLYWGWCRYRWCWTGYRVLQWQRLEWVLYEWKIPDKEKKFGVGLIIHVLCKWCK